MAKRKTSKSPKQIAALKHEDAKRKNIPTVELQSAAQRMEEMEPAPPVTYKRNKPLSKGETRPRDPDLDPQMVWKGTRVRLTKEQIKKVTEKGYVDLDEAQIVWRGKDQQDWSDLVVHAPPLYIQEKIHPKAIIDDLKRQTEEARQDKQTDMFDLFADFNGIDPEAKTEFYAHDQNWSNRMILGDSLQVMASLAEREGLRGQVQCIYFDPPYGIGFKSNWQVSTRSRDVSDGKMDHITREPEQVKAFRDTWKDGIHSYLTYLRDRLTAMRDLLTDSGSIFVQIGDENVHRVRGLMDEVFGEKNFISLIAVQTTTGFETNYLGNIADYVLWYGKDKDKGKARTPYYRKEFELGQGNAKWLMFEDFSYRGVKATEKRGEEQIPDNARPYKPDNIISQGRSKEPQPFFYNGKKYDSWEKNSHWKASHPVGMNRLAKAGRIHVAENSIQYVRFHTDFDVAVHGNIWTDTGSGNFTDDKVYVVQTNAKVIERCILMATDPGDLVLDPTCGSGTTATMAEQWGRRWITVDTSRVALALSRARLMGVRYPYYYLSDSPEGRTKEQEVTGKIQPDTPTHGDIRQGFVYERAPHITLKSIANNAEIDVIWENYQEKMEPVREKLNKALKKKWEEWEIPREPDEGWSKDIQKLHKDWWDLRIKRQQEIDKSIAQKADVEFLYDRPYEDKSRVRVAGPFTVESLSPHRIVPSDEAELLQNSDPAKKNSKSKTKQVGEPLTDFTQMVLENLKHAGVQQAAKEDKITFTAMEGWPGDYIAAEGHFMEGNTTKRAAIFIGPEFGTVSRADLTAAAREALDARFDALIACGFNFEAHTSELNKLGPLPILKAKMNPDLHMSDELKNTGAGNLFIIFGEPDVEWDFDKDGNIVVEVLGIDVFDPKTGDVRASGKDDIAAWFIDTDYNEESFFVRHAYFLGAQDPYQSLKTTLKAEIDQEAWETLYRDKSRPFPRPESGRFAVKVINHFGDEVMKVFAV
ncbi:MULTISPECIES: site-specific DNA-methyltransferase [unclassified Nitrospina]|uniref:site-specific DNA-methyltransferase n=1 Tax=unclassified Nitrospina TaxID=2638683 RepID=UPI003F9CF18D